ncbi:MAG: PAS domain-containing protein [Leptolyngbya sp. SIO3F4]|nr:PAS domain-containing protein [Leptolyngbya sp. SIO3F4]
MSQESLHNALSACQQELETLRRAHQQELAYRQQIEDELRTSQQLLQLVMDTLPSAIFWKDRNSTYLGCNRNFAEDAGLASPADIIGQDDYDMPWKKEEADFYRECDRKVMDANQPEFGIIEPQLHSNGDQTWLETNKAPLHDIEGNVIGILGTYEDITDRIQAELKLKELNQTLQQQQTNELNTALNQLQRSQLYLVQSEKMSALGNLVAGVAHEINNPLGFLSGNLSPAQEYVKDLLELIELYQQTVPKPGDAIEQEIEAIDLDFIRQDLPKLIISMKEGVRRIRDISNSLRTFSRADTDLPIAFNIHEGLDSTLLVLRHRLKANEQRPEIVVTKHYGNLPSVECFAGQLNQVFMNLISNAIDALDEVSSQVSSKQNFKDLKSCPSQIKVTTNFNPGENTVQICIADNGPGIPVDIQQKIFDQYFTTKLVGKGTGLGLAISHQIITEKHDGKLVVMSQPGEGAEFVITLPIDSNVDEV